MRFTWEVSAVTIVDFNWSSRTMLLVPCERVDLLGATEALRYVDSKNSDWVFYELIE